MRQTHLVPKLRTLIFLEIGLRLREIVFNQIKEHIIIVLGHARVVEKQCAVGGERIRRLRVPHRRKPRRENVGSERVAHLFALLHGYLRVRVGDENVKVNDGQNHVGHSGGVYTKSCW